MAEKNKIVVYQLLDCLPDFSVGGVQNYVSDLFCKEEFSGFDLFLKGSGNPDRFYRLSQLVLPGSAVNFNQGKPDILHIHQIMPYGLPGLVKLARRYPTVLTLHDYFLFCQRTHFYTPDYICPGFSPENYSRVSDRNCVECLSRGRWKFPYRLFLYFRKMFAGLLFKEVEYITLPNPDLLHLIPSVHHQKCFIIPYAIKKTDRKRSDKSSCNYVYLGHMVPHKGIFKLISELAEAGFKDELHIFGPPPASEILRSLPAFVHHRGLIEDYGVLSDYKGLIVPSLWRETGPLVLQEGIRAGIPVFVRRGAISDFYCYKGVYEFSTAVEILGSSSLSGNEKLPDLHEVRKTFFKLYRKLCSYAGRQSL